MVAFPSMCTYTSKHFSANCLCLSPTQPMKTCLTAIPGHPGKKMGHSSSNALDPTCSISTDTPARGLGTDFNQVEDFKRDLQSSESHLTWTGYNSFKTFTILTFSSYRTPTRLSSFHSPGSNLEDAMPPFSHCCHLG
jgi:hypothetical protein